MQHDKHHVTLAGGRIKYDGKRIGYYDICLLDRQLIVGTYSKDDKILSVICSSVSDLRQHLIDTLTK